jgi:NADPH:quinone reductase-like Zn-dependent oxidoreductase
VGEGRVRGNRAEIIHFFTPTQPPPSRGRRKKQAFILIKFHGSIKFYRGDSPMESKTFKAMIVEEMPQKTFTRKISEKSIDDLPDGDVLVRVMYSSLNYKDALSASGNKGVTRKYPHTPGIDAAGIVEQSKSKNFSKGDEVIVTSYDLGMNTSGGFGQYIRVPADWVVRLPAGLSLKESMIYGTAGFTAGLSVFNSTPTFSLVF